MSAPRSIPFYEEKFNYLTSRKGGAGQSCPIAKYLNSAPVPVHDLHHAAVHNTKTNRKIYPFFLHSLLNLLPVNHDLHLIRGSFGRKTDFYAAKWERFLSAPRHWKCKIFVNEARWPE